MTPPFHTSGNAKHYATPSYRHQSTLGGKFDRPATAFENALIIARLGFWPAVGLGTLFAVATLAFVALTGGI